MNIHNMTITQIKQWMSQANRKQVLSQMHHLQADRRRGIQHLVHQWQKNEEDHLHKIEQWNDMIREEQYLRKQGVTYIAGVDEVGRGPLAGPVVAAAVILPERFRLIGLNDSKQLPSERRTEYARIIKQEAIAYAIAFIDVNIIDQINIYQATKKSMEKAIRALETKPEFVLIDALSLAINYPQKSLIKGDQKSVSIAAASVLAKVSRDGWMRAAATAFPQYGFERNMGYGTKEHIRALKRFGPTPIHRHTFISKPLSKTI